MFKYLGLVILFSFNLALAEDIALTVEEYDLPRQRASLLVLDQSQVPLNTVIRVHSKTGTCEVRIIEKVNDHLIGATTGCEAGVINPGMKLAYSPTTTWEQPVAYKPVPYEPNQTTTNYDAPDMMDEILDRTTLFIGHNFSSELEGNVYANGSVKDLDGDTAFSMGIKARVYDFTDRVSLSTELGYETPRTFDQATFTTGNATVVQGTQGYSPRLTLWSLAAQGEFKLMDRLNAFGGLNLSIPTLRNSPFSMGSAIGFQGGANYQLLPQIALEGLIKITNMDLSNDMGETTDVSLAGLEIRGRYSF